MNFKSFIPFAVTGASFQHHTDTLSAFDARDPIGSAWSSHGLIPVEGDYFHDLDGSGHLCAIEFRDRVLPGNVIRDRVEAEAAHFEQTEGRKPGKKMLAQIREDVEMELLPKSHIRRTVINVMFTPTVTFVFTTSVKRCDTILTFLVDFFNEVGQPITVKAITPEQNPIGFMTALALEGHDDFAATSTMLLADESGESVVRIKDSNTDRVEYITLIKKGHTVREMGLVNASLGFTLTHSFAFKKVAFHDTRELTDDHAAAWMGAKEYPALVSSLKGDEL